jgi:hypothetical protein
VGAAAIHDAAAAAVAVFDHAETFVYTGEGGARVPDNVVRLRANPSVNVIYLEAVAGRTRLIDVKFCEGLREIQYRAFAGCTALVGPLRMPSSVRIIHEGAFEYCTALTEVMLQDGLKEIRIFAFWGCTALRRVKNWGTKTRIMLKERFVPTEDKRQQMGLVHPDVVLWRTHDYSISSERTLKPIFNSFAKIRGVSVRSLRLTYRGRTMLLNDMKNKTPNQLGMTRDHDKDEAITVVVKSEERTSGTRESDFLLFF